MLADWSSIGAGFGIAWGAIVLYVASVIWRERRAGEAQRSRNRR